MGIKILLNNESDEVKSYLKYKRLYKKSPYDKSIQQEFETCLARIQFMVSKKHTETSDKSQKDLAEKLMTKWNMYYY